MSDAPRILDCVDDIQIYDTLELSRRAYPDLPNHKLATMIDVLHLSDGPQTHRALDDAICTCILFEKCIERLSSLKEAELAARRKAKSPAPQPSMPEDEFVDADSFDDSLDDLSWLDSPDF